MSKNIQVWRAAEESAAVAEGVQRAVSRAAVARPPEEAGGARFTPLVGGLPPAAREALARVARELAAREVIAQRAEDYRTTVGNAASLPARRESAAVKAARYHRAAEKALARAAEYEAKGANFAELMGAIGVPRVRRGTSTPQESAEQAARDREQLACYTAAPVVWHAKIEPR